MVICGQRGMLPGGQAGELNAVRVAVHLHTRGGEKKALECPLLQGLDTVHAQFQSLRVDLSGLVHVCMHISVNMLTCM